MSMGIGDSGFGGIDPDFGSKCADAPPHVRTPVNRTHLSSPSIGDLLCPSSFLIAFGLFGIGRPEEWISFFLFKSIACVKLPLWVDNDVHVTIPLSWIITFER